MPVILATQEAEIRRIMIQSQPQANSSQTILNTEKGWWSEAQSSIPSTTKKKVY
jgi:hypothetical protein